MATITNKPGVLNIETTRDAKTVTVTDGLITSIA